MIQLSKPIIIEGGVLVPAETTLDFKNGVARYDNRKVERKLVPLQCIKGATGPFLHAFCATLLNDNRGFQKTYDVKYQDWAHCILHGDYLIVYVWDTRQVLDIYPGIYAAARGGTIFRRLINKKTGERIQQVMGHSVYGWAKSLYEMAMWPQYARPDNGLPLVTDNPGYKDIIDKFNKPINAKYSYESFDETKRAEYAKQGLAMPDGSYPITDIEDLENAIQSIGRAKEYYATKAFIIKRAKELDAVSLLPEKWLAANEAFVKAFAYNDELAKLAQQYGMKQRPANAAYRMLVDMSGQSKQTTISLYDWRNRNVIDTVALSPELSDKLCNELSEFDQYRIVSEYYDDLCCDAAEALTIVPDVTANQHNVLLDNIQVATIRAKQLEQISTSWTDEFDDAEHAEDDKHTEPQQVPAYKNMGDSQLQVIANDGTPMHLKCLDANVVLVSDLLDELSKALQPAKENLSKDIFNDYDNAANKDNIDGLKILYVNDLYELCQLIGSDKAHIEFRKNKAVLLTTDDYKLAFDFALDLVTYVGIVPAAIRAFVQNHFGHNLKETKHSHLL